MSIRSNIVSVLRAIYRGTPWPCVRQFYFRLFCNLVRGRKIRASIDGLAFDLDLGETVDVSLFLQQYEVEVSAAIEKYGRAGMTALDIGANIGAHTLRLAKKIGPTGTVHAFEPTDFAFEKMQRNLELNAITNVVPHKLALSTNNLRSQRIQYRSSWPTNGLALEKESVVDFQRLDDVLKELRTGKVSLIKLDVDGNEYSVLRGGEAMLRRDQPIILLEVWGPNFTFDETNPFVFLKTLGYRFFDLQTEVELPSVESLRRRVSAGKELIDHSFNVVAKPHLP
jgi:FkbM family methyltransferase